MRYILWVLALLKAYDVTNHGHHLGRHLGFSPDLENSYKHRESVGFLCLTCKITHK